ncbi:MAG: hypothetical protein K2L54_06085, partial [Clostridiales bacterium]|nr:hypothetical protein [Clostridiales bacterium]
TGLDFSQYPVIADDYSVQVIQIAEDINNGLVVYIYLPSAGSKSILATSINIAVNSNETSDRNNYKLTLLASHFAVMKYKVKGLTIPDTSERTYDVSTVFRHYNKTIDGAAADGTTVSEKAYPVGQLWTVTTTPDGEVRYSCKATEAITVTDRFDGTLRYMNGKAIFNSIDRHFIAFTTDRDIDEIFSADVTYVATTSIYNSVLGDSGSEITVNPPTTIHISRDELFSNNLDYWEKWNHSWYGVETVSEFLAKESLRDEVKNKVKTKKWVLSYLVTDFELLYMGTALLGNTYKYVKTSEVAMLQLKFSTDGIVYDIGVVDDKVTSDPYPVNWNKRNGKTEQSFWDKVVNFFKSIGSFFSDLFSWDNWEWILIVVLGVIILIALIIFIGPSVIFGAILTALKWLVKGLWWIICLPFKGIAALVRKIKERRAEKAA